LQDFIVKIEQGYLNQLATKDNFIDHLKEENKDLKEELANKNKPFWKRQKTRHIKMPAPSSRHFYSSAYFSSNKFTSSEQARLATS